MKLVLIIFLVLSLQLYAERLNAQSLAGDHQPSLQAAWNAAQAYSRNNQPRQAIPILRGMIEELPNNSSIHAQLGFAYFQARQNDNASRHIAAALSGDLTDSERRSVTNIASRLARQESIRFTFSLQPLYDSNPQQRTSADTIILGGLPFELDGAIEPSFGLRGRVGFNSTHFLKDDFAFATSGSVDSRVFEDSRLNDTIIRVQGGLNFLGDFQQEIGVGLMGMRRFVGNSRYSREVGLYFSAARQIDNKTYGKLNLDFVRVDHDRFPNRDGHRARVRLDINRRLNSMVSARVGVFYSRHAAEVDRESSRDFGFLAGATYRNLNGFSISGDILTFMSRRDGFSSLIGDRRADQVISIQVGISNQQISYFGFTPSLLLRAEQRSSNFSIASYKNASVSVSWNRTF